MFRWAIDRLALVAVACCLAFLLLLQRPRPAPAIPLFAHQYDVTCGKCHSVIPHLNDFGAAFMANGYRIRGIRPGPAFPLSAKINLVNSSEYQGSGLDGAGLPKAVVDEIELFTAGALGTRASYFVEQYVVDGGQPGLVRDAFIVDRSTPGQARIPVYVQAGSFTLRCRSTPRRCGTARNTTAYSIRPSARIPSTCSIRRWAHG